MTAETASPAKHGNAYQIFILILTLLSLGIMVVMLLPLSDETIRLLQVYDNFICVIFLIDFFYNLFSFPQKSDYFIRERGWLDMLGSIPSFGLLKYTALLRLFRLSRLARISRLLRGKNKEALIKDVIENRSRYALFITVLMTELVLTVASVLVLQFESVSPNANIKTGGDALWYSLVTLTTVGYGDRYPVTTGGRITAFFIMLMGVAVIGALASILSSVLVGSSSAPAEAAEPSSPPASGDKDDIAAIKNELAALRKMMEAMTGETNQE